jgi:hypothetical protein
MLARAVPFFRRWVDLTLSRPLALREAVIVAAILLTAGTIYCQIYCLLALQKMHGASMPLLFSVHRASVDVIAPFVVFELGKRIPMHKRLWPWIVLGALFCGGIATAALWRMQLPIMDSTLTPRRMVVDRIPIMALAAIALAHYHAQARLNFGRSSNGTGEDELPAPEWIDWVRAAGNYVEIRMGGRSVLKRMTMAQAEEALADKAFVRVHRSMLVNRRRIAGLDRKERPRHVRLTDGSFVKIGEAYRANLG